MAKLNGLRFFLPFALNYLVYSSISMDYTLENIELKGAFPLPGDLPFAFRLLYDIV